MYKPLKIFRGIFGKNGYIEEPASQAGKIYPSDMLEKYVGKKITVSRNNLGKLKTETATLMFEPSRDFFYIGELDESGRAAHYHIVHWDYTQQDKSENNRDFVLIIRDEAGEEIYNRLEWKNNQRETPCPIADRVVKNARKTRKELRRLSQQPETA
ncbi:MAG: hypothetical protein NTU57_01430 [Candidatus Aenigmarchaeota archaeon]|nr:hypothetical protein [Candidatus Aenigmarchaeota archaeon]